MSEEESESVSSSSSEEEDEDAKELTLDVEKKFLKTLQSLKTKDPAIYDANVQFFDSCENIEVEAPKKEKSKQKKSKPFRLSDYDKLLVKSGGEIKEDPNIQPSYAEEQETIKSNLKKALLSDSDSDDDSSLLTLKPKTKTETQDSSADEEIEIKHWLTGEKNELKDKKLEQELKPLHDIWTNPELDDGEVFLRDYILNKRYLDDKPKEEDEECENFNSEEEANFEEKQEEFEHKYNFRFEEPDQEFIKRYPRTMEASMRRKESKRKLKREQAKKNREVKLEKKKGEIKKLKCEKRDEILNHLKHLKSLTGNQTLAFKNEMFEGDFDPDQHDKIMASMFNEDFYAGQDEEKPVLEDDVDEYDYPDDEGETVEDNGAEFNNAEDWNAKSEGYDNTEDYGETSEHNDVSFAENGELITDCDYNPSTASTSERKLSRAKLKRLKRKEKKAGGLLLGAAEKSLFAQAVARPKPVFNPKDETFMKYVDEYYGLEFEDLIDDLPCRFKYKRVVPNSYGLSVEEILAADDKELNKWCPVKKIYSQRSEHVERNEVKVYSQRARDENLKKKLLPSLYKPPEELEEEEETQRILPTEQERKELMNKKQKKIQQISEEFEKEKLNKMENDGEEKGENEKREKDDVVDETIVNEYLKEKKRNVNARGGKRKVDTISESLSHRETSEKEDAAVKKKKKIDGKVQSTDSVDGTRKIKINEEAKKESSNIDDKTRRENCDKSVEKGVNEKEGGTKKKKKRKKKKKKKKAAISIGNKEFDADKIGNKNKTNNEKTKQDGNKEKAKHPGKAGGMKVVDKKKALSEKIANKQGERKMGKKGGKGNNKKKSMEKVTDLSDARLKAYGINPKKFKSKLLYGNKDQEKP